MTRAVSSACRASSQEIYEHPANAFVFKLLGNYNLFHGRDGDPHAAGIVSHIGFGGPLVKVEVVRDDKRRIDVDVPAPTFSQLALKRGDKVWFARREEPAFPTKLAAAE